MRAPGPRLPAAAAAAPARSRPAPLRSGAVAVAEHAWGGGGGGGGTVPQAAPPAAAPPVRAPHRHRPLRCWGPGCRGGGGGIIAPAPSPARGPHRPGTSPPSPSPGREILSPRDPQHSLRVRVWLLSRTGTQRPRDVLHRGTGGHVAGGPSALGTSPVVPSLGWG